MNILNIILALSLDIIPCGEAFLKQLQPRDSILIADQMEYGFRLDSVRAGTQIALQDFSEASNDTLTLVRNWKVDTLSRSRKSGDVSISASVVIAPFEEGEYTLPDILVQRTVGDVVDTLLFSHQDMKVTAMSIDTATFEIHDIKPQMRYPLTVRELVPWVLGFQLLAMAVILVVCLVKMRRRTENGASAPSEPSYIVALRALDRFRGEKMWAPDKQKAFYSGVTDTLKTYIEDRFGVDAPEMTTAELFNALRHCGDIDRELFDSTRELFERADFVKFAKFVASDEDNAKVLPVAVRFVTSTYQSQLEEEQKSDVL